MRSVVSNQPFLLSKIREEPHYLHVLVSFVKTGNGIDPVSLVRRICKDAHSEPDHKRSRFIKRMTPMTLMRKTMGGGLDHICQSVLRPHFHAGGSPQKVSIVSHFHGAFT